MMSKNDKPEPSYPAVQVATHVRALLTDTVMGERKVPVAISMATRSPHGNLAAFDIQVGEGEFAEVFSVSVARRQTSVGFVPAVEAPAST